MDLVDVGAAFLEPLWVLLEHEADIRRPTLECERAAADDLLGRVVATSKCLARKDVEVIRRGEGRREWREWITKLEDERALVRRLDLVRIDHVQTAARRVFRVVRPGDRRFDVLRLDRMAV